MNATTHAVFGVAALVGASLFAGEEPALYAYPAAAVAAWIPDVDNPRSRLGNGLSRTKSPLLDKLLGPVSWGLKALSFVLFRTVGHRTLTHSLLGVLIFAAIVSPLAPLVPGLYAALLAGYASHLFADALNTRGVPLLWPMGKPFRLLPGGVRSGGASEFVVTSLAVLVTGYGLYKLYPAIGASLSGALASVL